LGGKRGTSDSDLFKKPNKVEIFTLHSRFIYELIGIKEWLIIYDFVVFSFYLSIGFVGKFPAKTIPPEKSCIPRPPHPPRFLDFRSAKKLAKFVKLLAKEKLLVGSM
jgi:hypothetical protein